MEIKILGPGCRNCEKLFQDTKQAAKDAGVTADIDKITDMAEIMKRGILSTPGLMINGKVRSAGRLPSIREIHKWIEESLKENH